MTQNPAVHITPETPAGLWGQILLLERCYLRLHHIFTYAGLPLAVAGIIILWRRGRHRELALLLIPALTYYVAVIARVRAPEERYLLPIVIPLVLCAGAAIGALRHLPWGRKPAYVLAGGTLAAQFVFSFFPVTYCQMFDTKRDLQRNLSTLLPPQSPIAIHGMQTLNYPQPSYLRSIPPHAGARTSYHPSQHPRRQSSASVRSRRPPRFHWHPSTAPGRRLPPSQPVDIPGLDPLACSCARYI